MSQDEFTKFIATSNEFDRVVEDALNESKKRREQTLQYLGTVDEKLFSEMAEIKAKIDQVRLDIVENGQRLHNAFQNRSADYENKLKNESEKLNKLYQEFCDYKTSHDEIFGEFLKFQGEKEQFMAWFAQSRNMEKDKLGTIDDHIKQVNMYIERRNKVHDNDWDFVKLDLADSVAPVVRVDPTTTTSIS